MFRILGFFLKVACFSVFVLILGNAVTWRGRSLSDHVRMQVLSAEKSEVIYTLRNWAKHVTQDVRLGYQKKSASTTAPAQDVISASERQKLRALIRELNHPIKTESISEHPARNYQ